LGGNNERNGETMNNWGKQWDEKIGVVWTKIISGVGNWMKEPGATIGQKVWAKWMKDSG